MSASSINPAVGLENSRPTALLFEVIGANEVSQIRLPTDPQHSNLRHVRQLLFRLQWTLQAIWASNSVPTLPPVEGQTALRIILYVLKLCATDVLDRILTIDYTIFRSVALDALVAAIRVLLLSRYNISPEEEDVLATSLEELAETWEKKKALSITEEAFLHEFLLNSCILPFETMQATAAPASTEEARNRILTALSPSNLSLESLWDIHDLVTSVMLSAGTDGDSMFEQEDILAPLRDALKNATPGTTSGLSLAFAQYQAERLCLSMQLVQPRSSFATADAIIDRQTVARMGRVMKTEIDGFRRFFPAASNKNDIRQWVDDRTVTSTQSPPSIMSEDLQYSVTSSRSSPMEGKVAPASIHDNLNRNLSLRVEPLCIRPNDPRESPSPLSPARNSPRNRSQTNVAAPTPGDGEESQGSRQTNLSSGSHQIPASAPESVQKTVRMIQDATAALNYDLPSRKPVANHSYSPVTQVPEPTATKKPRVSDGGYPVDPPKFEPRPNSSQRQSPGLPAPSKPPTIPLPALPTNAPSQSRTSEAQPKNVLDTTGAEPSTETTSFAMGRMSLRKNGQHLPVSTFIPSPRNQHTPQQSQRMRNVYEDYPEVVVHPPAHAQKLPPATITNKERVGSGLEAVERSPTPPPKSPKQRVDMLPWAVKNDHKFTTAAGTTRTPTIEPDRRRESIFADSDTRSILSSSNSTASRKKSWFFGRMMTSGKQSIEPLPSSLEFRFATRGKHVTLWCKKDPYHVIQIKEPFESGTCYDLVLPESAKPLAGKHQSRSIRHLASSGNTIAALVHIEDSRWIYLLKEDRLRPAILIDETTPVILALALSPDGANVALGCGHFTLVYRMLNDQLLGPWKLCPTVDIGNRAVRMHKINFSIDSRRLISSIQMERNSQKHAVYVEVWTCFGADLALESKLDPVSLTMGYADDTGLSSISLVGHSDTKITQQVFLTAVLSKPYPSILSVTPGSKGRHLDIADARIDASAQSQTDNTSYFFAIRSGRHKIIRVDVRNGTTELVENFSAERKNIHPTKHDQMALSMEGSDTIRAMWRTADEGLVLKTSTLANGRWSSMTTELGPLYRQLSGMT